MGVYSTKDVKRQVALDKIYKELDSATNDELSEVLFELVGRKDLNNYSVWDDDCHRTDINFGNFESY